MGRNFQIDTSRFRAGIQRLVNQALPEQIVRGLFAAGTELLQDAREDIPRVPKKEGTLSASGSVTVLRPGEVSELAETTTPGRYVAIVGFNTPYAAYLHEGMRQDGSHVVMNWTLEGSGPKYLETPLLANRDRYIQIIVDAIKRG